MFCCFCVLFLVLVFVCLFLLVCLFEFFAGRGEEGVQLYVCLFLQSPSLSIFIAVIMTMNNIAIVIVMRFGNWISIPISQQLKPERARSPPSPPPPLIPLHMYTKDLTYLNSNGISLMKKFINDMLIITTASHTHTTVTSPDKAGKCYNSASISIYVNRQSFQARHNSCGTRSPTEQQDKRC